MIDRTLNPPIVHSVIALIFMALALPSCKPSSQGEKEDQQVLHIIHAGSLTYPVKRMSEAFREENPGVSILTEAWGSKAGARRVMELETPCDVFLSADYTVIENMLIPEHASWYRPFASNEMAIVYTETSRYAKEISTENWYDILLRPDVGMGRSDPDQDPCGVRAIFTAQLAEIFYKERGLAERLLEKDRRNIRPKETDLIALLESGHIDYIFLYLSVAKQHKLPHLRLPPELNLGDPGLSDWYGQVSTQTLGAKPGSAITETGQPMVYGLTIPHKSKNPNLARDFVDFVLNPEKGGKILEESGQPGITESDGN
ncbi:MAG: extracellular solute-binding protein [Bacteroidales bacterium]